MKLYIKNYSSYRSDNDSVEIKKVLKQKYKLDTRRQDEFIHLAVYGAQLLKEKVDISEDDELYLTSGIGNIDVVQRTNTYIYEENQPLKLFDFINLLGNTTSYYVAASLGISGKNIFQISDNFTYINSLVSLYASISNSKKNAILCAIDLVNTPDEVIKRVLGIDEDCEVVSSVNYQKFSLDSDDAMAELEFDLKSYSLEELETLLLSFEGEVSASVRCENLKLKKETKMFETMASYALNEAIGKSEDLIYVDCFEDRYKILKLKSLR
ncbi:MAG: hypothetical protein J7L21_03520 [Sulfurimonas sp.]|nr:hypothetical protein [Sulfurimonas sp.]